MRFFPAVSSAAACAYTSPAIPLLRDLTWCSQEGLHHRARYTTLAGLTSERERARARAACRTQTPPPTIDSAHLDPGDREDVVGTNDGRVGGGHDCGDHRVQRDHRDELRKPEEATGTLLVCKHAISMRQTWTRRAQ